MDAIFWRVFWKEYRLQRSLWLAMLLLTLGVHLSILAATQADAVRVEMLFGLALGLASLYGLGVGAVLFAGEHEMGTFAFQQGLPVRSGRVFFAKVTFALASTALLMACLWGLALILARGQTPPAAVHWGQWGFFAFPALEFLAWAILFSLLLKGPLRAAILGIAAASIAVHVCVGGRVYSLTDTAHLAALPWRAGVVAAVALVDVLLGLQWLLPPAPSAATEKEPVTPTEPGTVAQETLPGHWTAFGRLFWLHGRQSGWTMLALAIVGMLFLLPAMGALVAAEYEWLNIVRGHQPAGALSDDLVRMVLWGALGVVAPALVGVYAFRGDQRAREYRFLADHGVGPRRVWISRQMPWLAILAFWTVALSIAVALVNPSRMGPDYPWQAVDSSPLVALFSATRVVVLVVLACAAGQFCGMFLASGLVAAVAALTLAGMLHLWSSAMWILDVPWAVAVAPLPLLLLAATWVHAPTWLLDRGGWRTRLTAAAVVLLPLAIVGVTAAAHRAWSVPEVATESFALPDSETGEETARMYLRADELFVPAQKALPADSPLRERLDNPKAKPFSKEELAQVRAALLKANQEPLGILLQAVRRPDCRFPSVSNPFRSFYASSYLLSASAEQLQSEGKLDEALQHHLDRVRLANHLRQGADQWLHAAGMEQRAMESIVRWASLPGQSMDRILGAIGQLEELDSQTPPPTEIVKRQYWDAIEQVELDQPTTLDHLAAQPPWLSRYWFRSLPWERQRSRRVIGFLAAARLAAAGKMEEAVDAGRSVQPLVHPAASVAWTTAIPAGTWEHIQSLDLMLWQTLRSTTQRRVARIQLALAAWRLDRTAKDTAGEREPPLPETLKALAPRYLKRVPMDPATGEPPRYYPRGWPTRIASIADQRFPEQGCDVPPGTPFLWAAGYSVWALGDVRPDEESTRLPPYQRYYVWDHQSRWPWSWRTPTSEEDLLSSGWLYPLSAPTAATGGRPIPPAP